MDALTLTVRFRCCGKSTRDFDLIPVLGVGFVLAIVFLVGKTTMGV